MSTTPTEPQANPEATTPTTPAPAPEKAPAQETDWKAEARKWERRAKENKSAAEKLAEIEEANKSEAQKLADRLAAAEAKAVEAERKAFALTKGVPESLITGKTPEEWETAAEAALAWKGEAPKPPAAPSAAGQGKVGEPVAAGVKQLTRADLQNMTPSQIEAARVAGQLSNLMAGN